MPVADPLPRTDPLSGIPLSATDPLVHPAPPSPPPARLHAVPLRLTKHHGLGNDFLVHVVSQDDGSAAAGDSPFSPDDGARLAVAVCDRHRGIGADGLLLALAPPADGTADLTMRLHNADGSVAEMSGNGIRCFVQACVRAGLAEPGTVRVATDAGLRIVDISADDEHGVAAVRVDMGVAAVSSIPLPVAATAAFGAGALQEAAGVRARFDHDGSGPVGDTPLLPGAIPDCVDRARLPLTVDLGNPHIVFAGDLTGAGRPLLADLGGRHGMGATLQAIYADLYGGINVEVVGPPPSPDDPGRPPVDLEMSVYERGVGVTQACGTGVCAAAVAARRWGLSGDRAVVRQRGGDAIVELGPDGPLVPVTLVGPTQFVAALEFPWRG